MNRHHENHPDPEIREKYQSWKKAHGDYLARAAGFNSADEHKDAKLNGKAGQRNIQMLLSSITKGSNVQRKSTKQTVKRRLIKTAQRGG